METIQDLKKNLIAKIKISRIELGWSQTKLAKEAGTTPAAICRIEKGTRVPTLFMALKISKALGISIKSLCEPILDFDFDPDELKKLTNQVIEQNHGWGKLLSGIP